MCIRVHALHIDKAIFAPECTQCAKSHPIPQAEAGLLAAGRWHQALKLLYQQEPTQPRPVVYIIPIQNILGRLDLAPYGEHETIRMTGAICRVRINPEKCAFSPTGRAMEAS